MSESDRERINQQRLAEHFESGFKPNSTGPMEYQQIHALNYIAYQLGEIKQALRAIADAARNAPRA